MYFFLFFSFFFNKGTSKTPPQRSTIFLHNPRYGMHFLIVCSHVSHLSRRRVYLIYRTPLISKISQVMQYEIANDVSTEKCSINAPVVPSRDTGRCCPAALLFTRVALRARGHEQLVTVNPFTSTWIINVHTTQVFRSPRLQVFFLICHCTLQLPQQFC